jgi:hypothetical protein
MFTLPDASLSCAPLAGLIGSFGVRYLIHQYADDTHAVIHCNLESRRGTAAGDVGKVHIKCSPMVVGQSLNPSKSDANQFVTGRERNATVDIATVNVCICSHHPAGVDHASRALESCLTFGCRWISALTMSATRYFQCIRALRHVRCNLPDDVAKTVACNIVSSRLDYCNAPYADMSSASYLKVQRVQNTLVRVVLSQCNHVIYIGACSTPRRPTVTGCRSDSV